MRGYLVGWSVCVVLLGGLLSARAADAPSEDEQMLKQAGVATDGPGLVAFFRQRMTDVADEARIKALVRQLGDDQFKVREKASRRLVHLGVRARPFLQAATRDEDLEIARRARECLRRIGEGTPAVTVAAAVRVLARQKPPQAAAVLLAYLPTADDDFTAETIRQGLAALAVRDGKAEPALVAALSDKSADQRAAAAVALCHAQLPDVMPDVRKLLKDSDPRVRLRLGLALTAHRDKDAVPVLLRLLDELPLQDTEPLMELLERLADDTMPPVVFGPDAAAHRKYREAWQAWWKDHQAAIEPIRLEQASRLSGNTLVVLLDLALQGGIVEDLDAANRVRWKIENVQKPLDAQLLPGGERVLLAEHDGNYVSERDLKGKGKIVWRKNVEGPLAAQRLPNGHTFIVGQARLLEVDRDGKEVFNYTRTDGAQFMRAVKLRDGDIACVVSLGINFDAQRFVRLTPAGRGFKEVKSWSVQVRTSGGRLDVLPNGHVLIPEKDNNRVVEYDADGQSVREVSIEQPIAAVRLPNGNTIVTLMQQQSAVEVDRTGKKVWEFKTPGSRVTRALRR
jgi:HEAT repeat protein